MQLCIFEDNQYINFLPLVHFRPVYELRCGIFSLKEKILKILPGYKYSLNMRPELVKIQKDQFPDIQINDLPFDDLWFFNGRLIADGNLKELIKNYPAGSSIFLKDNEIAAAFIEKEKLAQYKKTLVAAPISLLQIRDLPQKTFTGTLAKYPWDLIDASADEIIKDFRQLKFRKKLNGRVYPGAHLLNKKFIITGSGTVVKPGAVLDAEKGPVVIGKNVTIMPNAVIEGPVYIGDNSVIKIGAKIYHGTSIGGWCKAGGEVEASVIQSYSNKQHEGFLGHSYLGSWVNLGADTNTSDLKNNYSTIRIEINGLTIDSNMQFLGLIMGDHSKSGINAMFDTGTVAGVSCNIFGAGLPRKFIPSFSWGGEKKLTQYDLEKSINTMKKVMSRRNVTMSEHYEELVRFIFGKTETERRNAGVL